MGSFFYRQLLFAEKSQVADVIPAASGGGQAETKGRKNLLLGHGHQEDIGRRESPKTGTPWQG